MLIEHLLRNWAGRWAIISAENPGAKQASNFENDLAMARLRRNLVNCEYEFIPISGVYGGIPEHSFIVFGISSEQAVMLGRKYDQESVLCPGGLIRCEDGSMMARAAGGWELVDQNEPGADNYSMIPDASGIEAFRYKLDWE